MEKFKPCVTPMATSSKLCKDAGEVFKNPSSYLSIIGSLQYLTLSRLDLSFTVNKLSQFLQKDFAIYKRNFELCFIVSKKYRFSSRSLY